VHHVIDVLVTVTVVVLTNGSHTKDYAYKAVDLQTTFSHFGLIVDHISATQAL
jgi:hypothetical protein